LKFESLCKLSSRPAAKSQGSDEEEEEEGEEEEELFYETATP
jgi:hypothetical protein